MRFLKIGFVVLVLAFTTGLSLFSSGPDADLDPYWQAPASSPGQAEIDPADWQGVLDDYLVVEPETANRFDYEGLKTDRDPRLDRYIEALSAIDPRGLSRDSQMAYWINLYNALTVRLVRDNFPVSSITRLGNGFLSKGPWNDEIVSVAGRALSLNDIEHRILRPIFGDYRIHFAVNCASIGCPDLSARAFTADNLEQQLDTLTRAYLSDPRGLEIEGDTLRMSKIFQWYREDFGRDEKAVVDTLAMHVDAGRAEKLRSFAGKIDYRYDWSLNSL